MANFRDAVNRLIAATVPFFTLCITASKQCYEELIAATAHFYAGFIAITEYCSVIPIAATARFYDTLMAALKPFYNPLVAAVKPYYNVLIHNLQRLYNKFIPTIEQFYTEHAATMSNFSLYIFDSFCISLMFANIFAHMFPIILGLNNPPIWTISNAYPDLTMELLMAMLLYVSTLCSVRYWLGDDAGFGFRLAVRSKICGFWSWVTVARVFVGLWYVGAFTRGVIEPGSSKGTAVWGV